MWLYGSGCSTFRSIHAPHCEHGPHGGLAWPRAGTLKQGSALRQEVILHPLHQQPLALHTVSQQRVRLQVCQELHTGGENTYTWTHEHTGVCENCYKQVVETKAGCVCSERGVRCYHWLWRSQGRKKAVLSLIERLDQIRQAAISALSHTHKHVHTHKVSPLCKTFLQMPNVAFGHISETDRWTDRQADRTSHSLLCGCSLIIWWYRIWIQAYSYFSTFSLKIRLGQLRYTVENSHVHSALQ